MSKETLSTNEVEEITGWSRPTVLKFAAIHGEMRDNRWHIPAATLERQLQEEVDEATARLKKLVAVVSQKGGAGETG